MSFKLYSKFSVAASIVVQHRIKKILQLLLRHKSTSYGLDMIRSCPCASTFKLSTTQPLTWDDGFSTNHQV